jgi:hypothetical protein
MHQLMTTADDASLGSDNIQDTETDKYYKIIDANQAQNY